MTVSLSRKRPVRFRAAGVAAIPEGDEWRADCMDDDEWATWTSRNPLLAQGMFAPRPCTDCPLGFALEMRSIGRCNGTPGGVETDPEDEPVGETTLAFAPAIPDAARNLARAIQQAAPIARAPIAAVADDSLTLSAPCEDCLHDAVCAIKGSLGFVQAELQFSRPLPPELTVRPGPRRIYLECTQFVDADDYRRLTATRDRRRDAARGSPPPAPSARHTDEEILAAVARHGGNQTKAGLELGYSNGAAVAYRLRRIKDREAAS